jgi:delta 1-pyrroline-5-carboxylate dehydrogenase
LVLLASLSIVLVVSKLNAWHAFYQLKLFFEYLFPVPLIEVEMTDAELKDDGVSSKPFEATTDLMDPKRKGYIQCFDPSTKQKLGEVVAMTAKDVHALCEKAAEAQKEWVKTSFSERRKVLRTIQKYIVHHIEDICRVSTRDSGKPKVDALLGEVLTTCEKIRCINSNGELWLQPEYRTTGPILLHKSKCQ